MFISQVTLHNYRGYSHTVVDLVDGLNVIYGDGDAGKSAFEKGIRWCLLNEKQGNYINKKVKTPGGKPKSKEIVYVEVQFSSGSIIRREADYSTPNIYRVGSINIPEDEWVELKNFGTSVPDPVLELINFTNLNVQTQFDPHFLLASKGGDIAKELNRMVNLEVIDTSTDKVNAIVRACKKEKDSLEFSVDKYSKDLEQFQFLEDMKRDVEEFKGLSELKENLDDSIEQINQLRTDLSVLRDMRVGKTALTDMKPQCEALIELSNAYDSTSLLRDRVQFLYAEVQEIEDRKAKLETVVQMKSLAEEIISSDVEYQKELLQYGTIMDLNNQIIYLEESQGELTTVVAWKERVYDISALAAKLIVEQNAFDELDRLGMEKQEWLERRAHLKKRVAKLKAELGDVCPYCGGPLKEDSC